MLPRREQAVSERKNKDERRKKFTDKWLKSKQIKAPKPQKKVDGKDKDVRDEWYDTTTPGLALRVTRSGHKSFIYIARYPSHPKHPTRRWLGDVGPMTLAQARAKAGAWEELIQAHKDPAVEELRKKAHAAVTNLNTFRVVAQAFIDGPVASFKHHGEAERIINQEFVKRWSDRPVTDIMPIEVAGAVKAIKNRGAPAQARNAMGYVRQLFGWAVGNPEYGITISPVAGLKPVALIGKKVPRERVLVDAELRAVWKAAEAKGYPYGPAIQLLILTGLRLREVADMHWSEVDLAAKLWTIPTSRMKGGRAQEVPLGDDAMALLGGLRNSLFLWDKGDFVFTTSRGEKPINGWGKTKAIIDRILGDEVKAAWVFHDLRRTMRTHLSALPVEDLVRELVIAHARPGLHKVYDQHSYRDEKRRCLELWEHRLDSILKKSPPAGVSDIEKERD